MNVFSDISGQDTVCSYLQAALDAGKTTHAYLFCGSDTSALNAVARRFGSALLANAQAEEFANAMRGAHPDMHEMEPAGAGGYLIEQVRELVHDAELAPVRAPHKVYIVNAAERLAGAPANALLKTLEEPPNNVVCILLARSAGMVLDTVRSRCELLRFREPASQQPDDAEVFAFVCDAATGADNRCLLSAAKRMVEIGNRGVEELEERQAQELEQGGDFLAQGAKKALEERHKREAKALVRANLLEEVAAVRSWLRDCLLVSQGLPDEVAHKHQAALTMQVATSASSRQLLAALDAAKSCEERISYNVTPQLAIEAMLFEIREAVCR